MEITLRKHNEEAYKKVEEGLKNNNRIAVVEPPGTGKSFIALKWIQKNIEVKTILLVPSYSIFLQYEEHMRECGCQRSDFPNLTIMTYAKLMNDINHGEIPYVDHIIFDEFHCCGAPEWGKGVQSLLKYNPNAKILGLSATPIRYLDKNRDMSDELFDGNVVFNMDLTEAVARGILIFPTYVNGIYKIDDDLKRYENEIEKITNNERREKLKEKIELGKRQLQNSLKLENLFFEHMKKRNGKYIVFCKDKNHMKEMINESKKWFSKVNPKMEVYSIYSEKQSNENELREFYYADNLNLKLLFCIDMLNEGFHVLDIDGIIMLRPTISPIIFLQQLGRALAVGNENTIIFDIVNNVRSGQNIRNFRMQVNKKTEELLKEDQISEKIELKDFKIFGELGKAFKILEEV